VHCCSLEPPAETRLTTSARCLILGCMPVRNFFSTFVSSGQISPLSGTTLSTSHLFQWCLAGRIWCFWNSHDCVFSCSHGLMTCVSLWRSPGMGLCKFSHLCVCTDHERDVRLVHMSRAGLFTCFWTAHYRHDGLVWCMSVCQRHNMIPLYCADHSRYHLQYRTRTPSTWLVYSFVKSRRNFSKPGLSETFAFLAMQISYHISKRC
jgi:hypothetical protein